MRSYEISVEREAIISAIKNINDGGDGPLLDLEWLLARLDDTVKYKEPQLKKQSIAELEKSLTEFRNENPGLLPVVENVLIAL
jgi:hypothetical protein